MAAGETDPLARFVERAGLQLEPWQLQALERLLNRDRLVVAPRQRGFTGTHLILDVAAALTIAEGGTVRFAAATREAAEAARQRALRILDQLDATTDGRE